MIGAYNYASVYCSTKTEQRLTNKVLSNGCQKKTCHKKSKHFDKNGWQEMCAGKPFLEFKTTQ